MTVFLQLIVLLVDINYLILLYMLSNQEIIYIVYYVVERVLSLLVLGPYGAATFGVLLGFIINLGILHLLITYNFQNLANLVLVIGILLGVISQILCFKNLTSCNRQEGMNNRKRVRRVKNKLKQYQQRDHEESDDEKTFELSKK